MNVYFTKSRLSYVSLPDILVTIIFGNYVIIANVIFKLLYTKFVYVLCPIIVILLLLF